MRNHSLTDWLRQGSYSIQQASIVWNEFLHVIGWINASLSWRVGSSREVRIGIDPMAGMEDSSLLSCQLIAHLNNHGVVSLDHIHRTSFSRDYGSHWLKATDLGLGGSLKTKWDHYLAALRATGIQITLDSDLLN